MVLSLTRTMRAIARLVAENLLLKSRMAQLRKMWVKTSRQQETLMLILLTMVNRVPLRTLKSKIGSSKI